MKRSWLYGFALLVALATCRPSFGQTVVAGSPAGEAFAVVPADAWAVVRVRNLGQFDQQLMTLAQKLGAPPMSPLMMAKGMFGLISGVDDAGDLLLVAMPAASLPEVLQGLAVLIPTTDFAELTSLMDLQALEGGVSKVFISDQEFFIAPKGKYAVLARSAEAAGAVLGATGGLSRKLSPHQLKRSDEDQITLWLNAEAIVSSPAVAPMLAMLQMVGVDTTALASLNALQVGLRFGPTGIRLGVNSELKEGTEQARAAASVRGTTKSLLTGLVKEDYVLALGMLMTEAGCENLAGALTRGLSGPQMAVAPLDPEKLTQFKELLAAAIRPTRSAAVAISALPPDLDGMIAFTKVVAVDGDASASLAQVGELIALIKGGLVTDEQVNKYLEHLEYTPRAETIDGISVDHLVFRLEGIEEVPPDVRDTLEKIAGKDGLLFRMGAVDATHIVATFGGGPQRWAAAAELVKSGKAPLADDPGIRRVAAELNKTRYVEAYVAVDHLMKMVSDIGQAVGNPVPIKLPKLDAPIALVASKAGKTASQMDVFLPMELITAANTAIQTAVMGVMQPTPAPMPPPTTAPVPAEPEP